tara:strand:+ start:452 stop:727 length:276 start_codon:yes stop_codon:yes gene_type:complete
MKEINKSDLFDIMIYIIENKDLFSYYNSNDVEYIELKNLLKKSLMVDDIQDYKNCLGEMQTVLLNNRDYNQKYYRAIKLYEILKNAINNCI